MARTGLDFDTVAAAAQRVSERGERVTLRSVRAEIGEGSLTTIQRHLADWQGSKERKQAAKVDAGLELPGNVVSAIMAEIETAKEAVREELAGKLADAESDRDALAAEVERLREELEELKEKAARESARCEMYQEMQERTEKQRKVWQDEATRNQRVAEANTARLEAAARELESLKASTKEMKEEAKQAREEAAELRGQLAALKETQKNTAPKPSKTSGKTE